MLTAARGLVGYLVSRFGTGSEMAAVAGDAVSELDDHLAQLERADLELRTGATA
ncbi:hypothetical protein GCM10027449_26400 [Sinomonas notoginsengisoli]|uniref:hypothetical protein n=1 Tax=Sinomonas notoginsengisoli TaxID=1457311 RepID=UPI001F193070|nr:hypothetical protein [Sinomonas notoginsengisoli]